MNSEDLILIEQLVDALEVAKHIIDKLMPLQIKYGVGINHKEQADLDFIRQTIQKAKRSL